MVVPLLIAPQAAAASLTFAVNGGSDAVVQVVEDRRTGYLLKVDCVNRCTRPLHFSEPIGDSPMGLIDLDRDGLIYSVWGTGCCYMVRVWKVTATGVAKVLECGSRYIPSLITAPTLTVVTYVRPMDAKGRQSNTSPRPLRWTYRHGRFERP